MREHEDELNRALKDTVPGLVQGSSETAVQATLATVGTDERLLGTDQHHRLLVKPDAFHITVLFQPMLAFIDRVMEILPSGFEAARASSAVLDEFVLTVYLPQLEEKVSLLFHQAVTGKTPHLNMIPLWLRLRKGPRPSCLMLLLLGFRRSLWST